MTSDESLFSRLIHEMMPTVDDRFLSTYALRTIGMRPSMVFTAKKRNTPRMAISVMMLATARISKKAGRDFSSHLPRLEEKAVPTREKRTRKTAEKGNRNAKAPLLGYT